MRWLIGGLSPTRQEDKKQNPKQENKIIFLMMILVIAFAILYLASFYL